MGPVGTTAVLYCMQTHGKRSCVISPMQEALLVFTTSIERQDSRAEPTKVSMFAQSASSCHLTHSLLYSARPTNPASSVSEHRNAIIRDPEWILRRWRAMHHRIGRMSGFQPRQHLSCRERAQAQNLMAHRIRSTAIAILRMRENKHKTLGEPARPPP